MFEQPRVIVLWAPDWPITAAAGAHRIPKDAPLAIIRKGLVHAASGAARASGVGRGLKLREAQARCPALTVLDYDPALDARQFEPVITGLEQLVPGLQILRPGVVAVGARGPARFYGGEREAAIALAERMVEFGTEDARAGVADGLFAAEQAARHAGATAIRVLGIGTSPQFLAPLPIGLLKPLLPGNDAPVSGEQLVTLLKRLGITTLGGFADLPAGDVLTRFGPHGARLHALAAGLDASPHVARTPPPDSDLVQHFEPPIDRADQLAFTMRADIQRFIDALALQQLVTTAITVELTDDRDGTWLRRWSHPRSFTPDEVLDRVRWQLEGTTTKGAIARVRITPASVDDAHHHEQGLFGGGPDARLHHALAKVQSMLGHEGVVSAAIGGGRTLRDRQRTIAWGDSPIAGAPVDRPWPGRLPDPLPGTVFRVAHPVFVFDQAGDAVRVTERGLISSPPARFTVQAEHRRIIGWAGPWPLDERWWATDAVAPRYRFQVIDDTHCAWLLVLHGEHWSLEARYD